MRERFWAVVAISAVGGACDPVGVASLEVLVTPAVLKPNGDSAVVLVTATDADGRVGQGNVHIWSAAGTLSAGLDLELDSYGRARTTLRCDQTIDPKCQGWVKVFAEWTTARATTSGEDQVNVRASFDPTTGGGTGTGGGAGGGSGVTCDGMTQCHQTTSIAYFETLAPDFAPTPGWGPRGQGMESTWVSSTEVDTAGTDCSGGACTRITLRTTNPGYAASPSIDPRTLDFILGHYEPTIDTSFGGSADEPQIHVGWYEDGKRMPPVSYQPYFDLSLCARADRPNVTDYAVCRLEVKEATVMEAHIAFQSFCVGTEYYVRGCVHFVRPLP